MNRKKTIWGYPTKSKELAEMKLRQDLLGGLGAMGDLLRNRNPHIVRKQHKDGSWWYHTIVDDI